MRVFSIVFFALFAVLATSEPRAQSSDPVEFY